MSNYDIGLSGLQLAQRAMDLIGSNVANATTPGYHRQELLTAPITFGQSAAATVAGVRVTGTRRDVDTLLERELIRQQTNLGLADQKLSVLQTVESALGDVGSGTGLGAALDTFFQALTQLPGQPQNLALQEQVIWAGDGLAKEFANLSSFLETTQRQMQTQAANLVDQINTLARRIAEGNMQVARASTVGTGVNIATDNRDQAISELSRLVDVDVTEDPNFPGVRNVALGGTLLVLGGKSVTMESGLTDGGMLGISPAGADTWITRLQGGSLGAVLGLANQDLPSLADKLDTLANDLITGINRLHVQGVGSSGSFSELTGTPAADGTLDSWGAGVTAGTIQVRVIDKTTGQVTRTAIAVDPATDTLASMAGKFSAVTHLTASVTDSSLHLEADSGYAFDFVPALDSQPAQSTLTGTASPTISGTYTGTENRVYTCTVEGTGQVGITDGLSVAVRDGSGALVKTLRVGGGYAADDGLEIADGIRVSLGTGTLKNGETFTVEALADTDTSGFLAAAGINTFFEGTGAGTIAVRQEIVQDPGLLAVSTGPLLTDGANAERMAALGSEGRAGLGGDAPAEYYQQLVTRVGQMVSAQKATQTGVNSVIQQITLQQEAASGVDINDQAATLMTYERMYQAMAKFISTLDKTMSYLMEAI